MDCYSSLDSVIDNYEVFQMGSKDLSTDSKSRSRISGVEARMKCFEVVLF